MSKKAVFLSKRLDRISPACDRAYIRAGYILCSLCALASVAIFIFAFCNIKAPFAVTTALIIVGFTAQVAGLFCIIKEIMRNRFFSAVIGLVFSIVTAAAMIAATVLFIC